MIASLLTVVDRPRPAKINVLTTRWKGVTLSRVRVKSRRSICDASRRRPLPGILFAGLRKRNKKKKKKWALARAVGPRAVAVDTSTAAQASDANQALRRESRLHLRRPEPLGADAHLPCGVHDLDFQQRSLSGVLLCCRPDFRSVKLELFQGRRTVLHRGNISILSILRRQGIVGSREVRNPNDGS